MALSGLDCVGCGRSLLDSGTNCIFCNTPHSASLRAELVGINTRKSVIKARAEGFLAGTKYMGDVVKRILRKYYY